VNGYLLDTNIISALEPGRATQSPELAAWLEARSDRLYLSVISAIEVEAGIRKLRRKRSSGRAVALDAWLTETIQVFGDHVLALDVPVARAAGAIVERMKATGEHPSLADIVIAATAQVYNLLVLTANTRHFAPTGVPNANPLQRLPD
jgi:toxin FitB